jgi:peptidoglycan/xylan/chitin deacetylase (PgdA/CDA1 family)
VHCAVNLDTKANLSLASIDGALDRARDRGEIVELYAHKPDATVKLDVIEHVLAGAAARGLAPVTYTDFATGDAHAPGLALSFDDTAVRAWTAALPLFAQYNARVTFFVSRYGAFYDEEKALVRALATAGHDIEPHTVNHLNGPAYVEANGLGAYLRDEVWPSIDALETDGYTVSAFAYPFGARTREIDDAIQERVPVLRSVEFSYSGVVSPCPE